jgi:hypothetical protein
MAILMEICIQSTLTTQSSEADIQYLHDFLHFARLHTVNNIGKATRNSLW